MIEIDEATGSREAEKNVFEQLHAVLNVRKRRVDCKYNEVG